MMKRQKQLREARKDREGGYRDIYRCHHLAWTNGCDTLTVVGLHENWTLALRFQVSGVRSEKAKAGLTPDTRHLKPMLGVGL